MNADEILKQLDETRVKFYEDHRDELLTDPKFFSTVEPITDRVQ